MKDAIDEMCKKLDEFIELVMKDVDMDTIINIPPDEKLDEGSELLEK